MTPRRKANPRKETRKEKVANARTKPTTYKESWIAAPLEGKTRKQDIYLRAIQTDTQIFAIGPAGTGKTYLPTAHAADQLKSKRIEKLILTRPNVPGGPSLGYFKGDLEEKIAPWVVPFMETIKKRIGPGQAEYLLKEGSIEIVPFEVMRGRTFENAIVIVDEAQNLTPAEMFMVLTRIGEDSQLIVTGDYRSQKDIKGTSGLAVAIDTIRKNQLPVSIVEFEEDDIVRSGVCRLWVKNWPQDN